MNCFVQKTFNEKIKQSNNSITSSSSSSSSSVSYASILSISIPNSNSHLSEIRSSIHHQISSFFEQIFTIEKTYHNNLKAYIIKYSRPLRRYFNSNEIVDLFYNIEKVIYKIIY